MKVAQVMTNKTACLNIDSTIYDAAMAMLKHNIGFMPICENDKVVGVLTDRDVVTRGIANRKDPSLTTVNEIMTQEIYKVAPDTNMTTVADIMSEHKIRRLPVLDHDTLVGIVSIGDIATHDTLYNKAKQSLTDISTPSEPVNM